MELFDSRYSRQIKLDAIGESGQQLLQDASVLIIGAGGLGYPAAQYLTAAGVGRIGLVDHDRVEISNLNRQLWFTPMDVGSPKVEIAKKQLHNLNQGIEIDTHFVSFDPENAETLVDSYDVVIDATDNFVTKYLINDACLRMNKTWVYASIYKFEGQIAVFNYQSGPTYRCLFPSAPQSNQSCQESGVIGATVGVIGSLQALEAIKLILNIGKPLSGRLKLFNLLSGQEQTINFSKNEEAVKRVKQQPLSLTHLNCETKQDKSIYLDVREPYEQPRIRNANVLNIPLNELTNRYHELPLDRLIYVVCQSGLRSKQAIQILKSQFSLTNLVQVKGGIKALM